MQHLEKKYTANFAFYPLLFRDLASQNIMRNKGDEVGNRTGYKNKGKRKKERAKQKSNWNRKKIKQNKSSKFWPMRMREKPKKDANYIQLAEI